MICISGLVANFNYDYQSLEVLSYLNFTMAVHLGIVVTITILLSEPKKMKGFDWLIN